MNMVEKLHTFEMAVGYDEDHGTEYPFYLELGTDLGFNRIWVSYDTIQNLSAMLDKAKENYARISRLHEGYH